MQLNLVNNHNLSNKSKSYVFLSHLIPEGHWIDYYFNSLESNRLFHVYICHMYETHNGFKENLFTFQVTK